LNWVLVAERCGRTSLSLNRDDSPNRDLADL
jgi:hypothetical protein